MPQHPLRTMGAAAVREVRYAPQTRAELRSARWANTGPIHKLLDGQAVPMFRPAMTLERPSRREASLALCTNMAKRTFPTVAGGGHKAVPVKSGFGEMDFVQDPVPSVAVAQYVQPRFG